MIGDPNWLYTTIAQASAAIVAIVGGFITATLLMLTSEKRSLTHQLNEKETRLNVLLKEEDKLRKLYERTRVQGYLNLIIDGLKKEDKLPPIEKLLERHPYLKKMDYETLKQEYENMSKQRFEARQFIEQHSDTIDPTKFTLFDEWVKENNLDISSYDYILLMDEYDRFRARETEIREEEKKRTMPFLGWNSMPLSPITEQYKLSASETEDRRLEEVERRLNGVRHEIFLLAGEVTNLDSRLKAFSYPPNLRWGIAVLSYLAVVSIIFPVMVISNEAYSPDTKHLVIGLFISGLAAIFAFIVSQIRTLRR